MRPEDYPLWFILTSLFLLGTVFGSFLNVCIHRFPKHERLKDQLRGIWGRSNCPRCHTEILARDNIPIFGWLMLRGKCRNCQLRISPRYPLIELLNGLLFVLVYWFELPDGLSTYFNEQCCYAGPTESMNSPHLGPQIVSPGWSAPVWMHMRYVFHMVLIEALVVATFIDLDLQIIPDGSTVPAMIFAVLAATALGQVFLVPVWFDEAANRVLIRSMLPDPLKPLAFDFNPEQFASTWPHFHGLAVSVVGLIVGGGMIWMVRIIGQRVLRQEAMGFGDVVLMACIGSFIGWQPAVIVFFLAAICAMVSVIVGLVFQRRREIPYGPYLSLATVLLILFWDHIWPYAKGYFDLGIGIFFVAVVMCVALFASLLMLQGVKRILGIPLYYTEEYAEWTSADTLHHYAGERIDEQQGQWRRDVWEGTLSSRGLRQQEVWRRGR